MIKDFKAFIMRGNVIDLAVAVVLAAAFGAVVNSFVVNVINPIIGLIGGQDFSTLTIDMGDTELRYGAVITALINFALVAAAVFFMVVKPVAYLNERRKRGELDPDEEPAPSDEALLLAEIRDLLSAQQAT